MRLDSGSLFHFLQHFLYDQRPICTILGEMTDADEITHPRHFGTDPTDIRIRINPKIRIPIPDHFCLAF